MGKGGFNPLWDLPHYSWDEIKKHSTKQDRWIVIRDGVYDVTDWCKKHPGGDRMIGHFAGHDATDAWVAFHTDHERVSKYMKPLKIGQVTPRVEGKPFTDSERITEDFRIVRKKAEEMNLFEGDANFFTLVMAHLLLFEFLGWFVIYYYGSSWLAYILGAVLLTVTQAQSGWAQHDYGHLSVFKNNRFNHAVQIFIIGFLKGASSDWWNYRHFNHHAKPNIVGKDPDIRLDMFFLLGKHLPVEWAKKKKGFMPYKQQHKYWYLTMPPLLLPLYFNYEIPYFLISRKKWMELFWMGTFFLRWQFMFSSVLGFWGVFKLFLFVRFLESHWFVWTTQMNHIPMEVNYDQHDDWPTMQLKATCNVEPGWFNDWFSGHLNYQIEHHFFPTMPRHNYHKIRPMVRALCKKHGLEYQSKPYLKACADIMSSLKESGQLWADAYEG